MPELNSVPPYDNVARYYDRLVAKYGHDPRACDYGRPESQHAKFLVLAEVADLSGKSVLDVGCGFADFAAFLAQRFHDVNYSGIDLSPAMIETARGLHPGLDLQVSNIADHRFQRQADVVVANGIFYLLGEPAPLLMRELVTKMYALARHAVAFNSLSSWAADQEPGEFYANPAEILDFCRTLTPWVVCRHDYHSRDFTIYLYRNRQES